MSEDKIFFNTSDDYRFTEQDIKDELFEEFKYLCMKANSITPEDQVAADKGSVNSLQVRATINILLKYIFDLQKQIEELKEELKEDHERVDSKLRDVKSSLLNSNILDVDYDD